MEDARTWVRRLACVSSCPVGKFSSSIAPSFVEAVAGERNSTPDPAIVALLKNCCAV